MIPREDGGAVFTAEYYSVTVSGDRNAETTVYHHGPVIAASVNAKGDLDWGHAIPKNQIYRKRPIGIGGAIGWFGSSFWFSLSKDQTVYHSYLLGISEGSLNFIYNDHPDNIKITHNRNTHRVTLTTNNHNILLK